MDKVLYEELTPREFLARLEQAPVAHLPLGTLEWHGAHMPLGSDGLQSKGFFAELAQEVGGVVLPMLFVGPDRHNTVDGRTLYGKDICVDGLYETQQLTGSAYWVDDDLFNQLLQSILARLKRAGFRVVVGHGHGPSTKHFRDHIDEWSEKFGMKLFICWRDDDSDGFGIQTDHGGGNETSLVMALRPELVQMENLPKDPNVWPLAISGKDPRKDASPQIGRQAVDMQVKRMAGLVRQALAQSD